MVAKITTAHPTESHWDKKAKPSSFYERVASTLMAPLRYARSSAGALGDYLWVSQPKSPYESILREAPAFNGYKLGKGTPYPDTSLTSLSVRPANLFYEALLGPGAVSEPGSGKLFSFRRSFGEIRKQINEADPNAVVAFSAKGVSAKIHSRAKGTVDVPDLAALHGDGVYRISYGELQSTLASQKIFLAPLLPLPFYKALKEALLKDGIVTLPGGRRGSVKFSPATSRLIKDAAMNYQAYGFQTKEQCSELLKLNFYQLGALVVKREDFRIFIDGNGKILERKPGDPDAIRLINACGIRGIQSTPRTKISNRTIMTQTFQTALHAAERGLAIFPAVGMGVWQGDPDLYWRAFLDAVIQMPEEIEQVFVSPGHQATPYGRYQGCKGEEFQAMLNEYRKLYANDPKALSNLNKIMNLYERKTDVVQFAHRLKKAYPAKVVSLFNASDPDVTLGNHVGEYVNHVSDNCSTTEENYTALGTNGLCFEGITGVHRDPSRVVAVR
jgi:hypothetical protein